MASGTGAGERGEAVTMSQPISYDGVELGSHVDTDKPLDYSVTTSLANREYCWVPLEATSWLFTLDHGQHRPPRTSSMAESIHGIDVGWLHHPHKNQNPKGMRRRSAGDARSSI